MSDFSVQDLEIATSVVGGFPPNYRLIETADDGDFVFGNQLIDQVVRYKGEFAFNATWENTPLNANDPMPKNDFRLSKECVEATIVLNIDDYAGDALAQALKRLSSVFGQPVILSDIEAVRAFLLKNQPKGQYLDPDDFHYNVTVTEKQDGVLVVKQEHDSTDYDGFCGLVRQFGRSNLIISEVGSRQN